MLPHQFEPLRSSNGTEDYVLDKECGRPVVGSKESSSEPLGIIFARGFIDVTRAINASYTPITPALRV
jgi:hypothetical protein